MARRWAPPVVALLVSGALHVGVLARMPGCRSGPFDEGARCEGLFARTAEAVAPTQGPMAGLPSPSGALSDSVGDEPIAVEVGSAPGSDGEAEPRVEQGVLPPEPRVDARTPRGALEGRSREAAARRGSGAASSAGRGTEGVGASEGTEGAGDGAGSEAAVPGLLRPMLRVLPLALSATPSWTDLRETRSLAFDLGFVVTPSGRIELVEPVPATAPAAARATIDQALRLLSWPKFALRPGEAVASEVLRFAFSLSQDERVAQASSASGGVYGLGAEPPQGKRKGRAHCTWASGARVDVVLDRVAHR